MKYKKSILTIVIFVILACQGLVFGEIINDDPEAVSLYEKGKRLMREGEYYEASRVFEELSARFADSPNLDRFIFNRAKAEYYFGEYYDAAAGFQYFINKFPNSPYLSYAHFFLGNASYRKGEVKRAFRNYLLGFNESDDNELNDLIEQSLSAIFKNASTLTLNSADFDILSEDKRCFVIKMLADEYLTRREITKAEDLLRTCGESIDATRRSELTNELADKPLEIAVVVPLSGDLISFGEELYNGAVIASEELRGELSRPVKIVPYDTKGDPIEAARIVKELANSAMTDIVIGPLTSEESSVASATLGCFSLPMIAPAATEAGLTMLSETSFQLSPNIELQGIVLAEYAVNSQNAKEAVIISSSSTDNIRISRSFKERFEELGGRVKAVEYYRSRDNDFGIYLRDIKRELIGPDQDSIFYISPDGDTLDWDVVAADVDCILVPGSSRQLRQLIPQIHFYHINGMYLGNDGWGSNEVYKLGDNITKSAVFTSPFLGSRNSEPYIKLAAAYDSRYGKRPQRLTALGYDAVKLVMEAVKNRGMGRQNISGYLENVVNYEGASGKISFGQYRENIEMPLYQIKNEDAEKIPVSISGK